MKSYKLRSFFLFIFSIIIGLSLISYNQHDPSFNLVTSKLPLNILGKFGSYLSDLLYQIFGSGALLIALYMSIFAFEYYRNAKITFIIFRLLSLFYAVIGFSFFGKYLKFLPFSEQGFIVVLLLPFLNNLSISPLLQNFILAILFMICCLFTAGFNFSRPINFCISFLKQLLIDFLIKIKLFLIKIRNNIIDYLKSIVKKIFTIKIKKQDDYLDGQNFQKKIPPIKSNFSNLGKSNFNNFDEEDNLEKNIKAFPTIKNENSQDYAKKHDFKEVNNKILQEFSSDNQNIKIIPPIDLLRSSKHNKKYNNLSELELKKNAEDLIKALKDFGIRGQIINVNQGPVITLYEFEPSAGTKSSRVIGLSDDIARSMCALSTRISIIPGRNALGIELPNKDREFFTFRELLETEEYQNQSFSLPLVLGKDIAGRSFIADLAKMPHLLVAGTTGSGKSVAINAMIMSLLYRYEPKDCRLIMIDPKMLELSIYDNIPHLLTPVVTESSKAVVALKWAVKEMESRYKLMANLGVRNITSYNAKIKEYIDQNKNLERKIQTGFDNETGEALYQTVGVKMEKMPFIVIIVDEMADLMLVAGKDVESLIQRLAQMARAAGIHIIMATQRPSVDVITGIIKANFPSRISFKLITKIDSRTILSEQGAEQLLGMGDMLYMGNGSAVQRVHGPFVDDQEVERVTNYLRSVARPEYLSDILEESEDEDFFDQDIAEGGKNDNDLYSRALQIVKNDRKVSISYIQRSLRIGYNRAADIVEKMEKEGIISPPNHSGKREILLT